MNTPMPAGVMNNAKRRRLARFAATPLPHPLKGKRSVKMVFRHKRAWWR